MEIPRDMDIKWIAARTDSLTEDIKRCEAEISSTVSEYDNNIRFLRAKLDRLRNTKDALTARYNELKTGKV